MPYMIGTPEGHSLCHGPRADVSCLPHLSQHGHLAPEEIKARDGGLCNATSRIAGKATLDIAWRQMGSCHLRGTPPRPLEVQKHSLHSYGMQFC
jgi:hypothetical protein